MFKNYLYMTDTTKVIKKKYLDVDLWQSTFGEVSVRAIYYIYSQKLKSKELVLPKRNGYKLVYSFPNCVRLLRNLENTDYKAELEFKKI